MRKRLRKKLAKRWRVLPEIVAFVEQRKAGQIAWTYTGGFAIQWDYDPGADNRIVRIADPSESNRCEACENDEAPAG